MFPYCKGNQNAGQAQADLAQIMVNPLPMRQ